MNEPEVGRALEEIGRSFAAIGDQLRELGRALAGPEPTPKRTPRRRDQQQAAFRDWVVRREKPFSAADVREELGWGPDAARKLVAWASSRKIVAEAGTRPAERRSGRGGGRPSQLYRYVAPEEVPGGPARRGPTPERGNGAATVAGTGKRDRFTGDREAQRMVERVVAAGFRVRRGNAGHLKVYDGDQLVASMPATPSDHRALANARKQIERRTGVRI